MSVFKNYQDIVDKAKAMADAWNAIPNKPWTFYGWSLEDKDTAFIDSNGEAVTVTDEMSDARKEFVKNFTSQHSELFKLLLLVEVNQDAVEPYKVLHETYRGELGSDENRKAFIKDYESLKNINEADDEIKDMMMVILMLRYLLNAKMIGLSLGDELFDELISKHAKLLIEAIG